MSWVGAFDGEELVGFVHACWDGGAHAFLLDTCVDPGHRRRGVGEALVRTLSVAVAAAAAGCTWLHVDSGPGLADFYHRCGSTITSAGLRRLTASPVRGAG